MYLLILYILCIGGTSEAQDRYHELTSDVQTEVHKQQVADITSKFGFSMHPFLRHLPEETPTHEKLSRKTLITQRLLKILDNPALSHEMTQALRSIIQSSDETLLMEAFLFTLPKVKNFAKKALIQTRGTLVIKALNGATIKSLSRHINALAQLLWHACIADDNASIFKKLACSLYADTPNQFATNGPTPLIVHTPFVATATKLYEWLINHPLHAITYFQRAYSSIVSEEAGDTDWPEKIDCFAEGCHQLRKHTPGHPRVSHEVCQLFRWYFLQHASHAYTVLKNTQKDAACSTTLKKIFKKIIGAKDLALLAEALMFLCPKVINFATSATICSPIKDENTETDILLTIHSTPITIKAYSWLNRFCMLMMDVYNMTVHSNAFRQAATSLITLMPDDVYPPHIVNNSWNIQHHSFTIKELVIFLTHQSATAKFINIPLASLLTYEHFELAQKLTSLDPFIGALKHMPIPEHLTSPHTTRLSTNITHSLLLKLQRAHPDAQDCSAFIDRICQLNQPAWKILTLHCLCPIAPGHYQVQMCHDTISITTKGAAPLSSKKNSVLHHILWIIWETCLHTRS